MGSSLVALNGAEAWGYVVELDDGMRVRFALDDWQRMNLGTGQRVPVRLPGRAVVWLFITRVTELPPVVWVILTKRVRGPNRALDGGEAVPGPESAERSC